MNMVGCTMYKALMFFLYLPRKAKDELCLKQGNQPFHKLKGSQMLHSFWILPHRSPEPCSSTFGSSIRLPSSLRARSYSRIHPAAVTSLTKKQQLYHGADTLALLPDFAACLLARKSWASCDSACIKKKTTSTSSRNKQ